ncbi:MAG: ABC transporter substrate-binding protein, partial [Acidobacteriota bacterium]
VFLSPTASTARMAGISRHVFRLHPSATREAAKMGAFAAHDLGLETVAILAPKNRFALDLVDAFREPFEDDGERGGRVVEVVRYVPTPGAVPRAVDRALSGSVGGGARSQGVYLAAPEADPAAREVLRELARRDYRGAVLATSAFAARRVLNQIGNQVGRGAEGLLLPRSGFDPESEAPEVREFVEAYRQEYGEDPTPGAAYGYDAVMVLARALEDQGPVPYQLWQGVRGLSDYAGVTGPIRFDERGEVGRFPRVYVVRRGELERVRALDERARNRLARL